MESGKLSILYTDQKKITKKVHNNITKSIQSQKWILYIENSKTSKSHVLILKLSDKSGLRRDEKSIALSSLSIYYTWKNIKSSYNNNKYKMSPPTWNDKFQLHDG